MRPDGGVLVGRGVQVAGNSRSGVSVAPRVPDRVAVGVKVGVQVSSGVFVGRGVRVGSDVAGTSGELGVHVGSERRLDGRVPSTSVVVGLGVSPAGAESFQE